MSVPFYHGLLSDRPRIEAFRSMIHNSVGPGKTVVEVGAGLGTYALFCAQAGASRVWAVESDPVIHVAEQIAALNGFKDRVHFVRGTAPEVDLPELADVLIFEDFPTRLLDQDTVRLMRACADKYLKPSGLVLPGWARLNVAPVRTPEYWTSLFPFGPGNFEAFGLDFTPSAGYAQNEATTTQLGFDVLVAEPVILSEVPIHPSPDPARLGGRTTVHPQGGAIHGLSYWFDLWTGGTTWLSNAPGARGAWGQLFLPFRTPLNVEAGAAVDLTVEVMELPDGSPGWISWQAASGHQVRRGHEFAGHPANLEDLFGAIDRITVQEPDATDRPRADDGLFEGPSAPVQ